MVELGKRKGNRGIDNAQRGVFDLDIDHPFLAGIYIYIYTLAGVFFLHHSLLPFSPMQNISFPVADSSILHGYRRHLLPMMSASSHRRMFPDSSLKNAR